MPRPGVVMAGHMIRGWGKTQKNRRELQALTSKEFYFILPWAMAVISSVLLFLWTIKVNQISIKGSFSRPGKPLLYDAGDLFRGYKNKGTSGSDAIFPRNSLAELLPSAHPSKPHLPWEGAWPVSQGRRWNPRYFGVKRAGFQVRVYHSSDRDPQPSHLTSPGLGFLIH